MSSINISPKKGLHGTIRVPGDKSISHRIAMLGALAKGETRVEGFLMAEDCLSTLKILDSLGIRIEKTGAESLVVHGKGMDGLHEPDNCLDAGNSGTTIRLISGILAAQPFFTVLTGDASLRKRPMGRIIKPLCHMGARIWARAGDSLPPIAIKGGRLKPISYQSPHASAQVKSAILLAGLWADGRCDVKEPDLSRDHTERMLRFFGLPCRSENLTASVEGVREFSGCSYKVPGDFSAAAFFIVAALISKGSDIVIKGLGINPTRAGLLEILQRMGGRIEILDERMESGEPVADLRCISSGLRGINITGEDVPRMIDEFPVFFLAATQAEGDTLIRGAYELRVKESDRIATMAAELRNIGADVEEMEDGMLIRGGMRLKGGLCSSHGDHRVAMTMAVAGLISEEGVVVEDWECVNTSFPDFLSILQSF
ncbi:3-phosphoshikimate 1-carboxyvinyltransferase [bacterium]|nr:3-phosphoshikimate 1-carboxyvinyltransferase [bacterium]